MTMPSTSTRPPSETLTWVERCVGRGARVVAWRRLTGGLTSVVQQLTVERNGRRTTYVLRRWPDSRPDDAHLDDLVSAEARILTMLETCGIPAPRLVGHLTAGSGGAPALLMTRVPGRLQLMPRDRHHWLRQMALMLARIHALDVDAPPFESWLDVERLSPPSDSARPDLWREAASVVPLVPASTERYFIHRDYQHFNLLWSRDRLTGVVDWAGASVGPPDIDVGHCRLNLTLLFTAEVAERFREMYEAEAGRCVEPSWDLHALLAYDGNWKYFLPVQVDKRAPIDPDGMTRRMEVVLERTLRRL